MPRLDDLPPDLRATLSLLVDRGKSYAQVAELLGIPETPCATVRTPRWTRWRAPG